MGNEDEGCRAKGATLPVLFVGGPADGRRVEKSESGVIQGFLHVVVPPTLSASMSLSSDDGPGGPEIHGYRRVGSIHRTTEEFQRDAPIRFEYVEPS